MLVSDDKVTVPPWYSGLHGRAWKVEQERRLRRQKMPLLAGLQLCLVEAPWAHPIWHSYWISLIHLRPVEGLDPPKIYLPGATHEFWLVAADPDYPREPQILGEAPGAFLSPMNFAAQFIAADDAAAIVKMDDTAKLICDGRLNPDTDFTQQWVAQFSDHMLKDRGRGSETVH